MSTKNNPDFDLSGFFFPAAFMFVPDIGYYGKVRERFGIAGERHAPYPRYAFAWRWMAGLVLSATSSTIRFRADRTRSRRYGFILRTC